MASTPRLTPLLSLLRRQYVDVHNPTTRAVLAAARMEKYHASPRLRQVPTTQRYGTANEPPPHLTGGQNYIAPPAAQSPNQKKALPKIGDNLQKEGEKQLVSSTMSQETGASKNELHYSEKLGSSTSHNPLLDAGKEAPSQDPPGSPRTLDEKPLESVLNSVPAPTQRQAQQQDGNVVEQVGLGRGETIPKSKAPHIDAPRHVHHFDTYGLVKRLVQDGWDETQAITIMKAVRIMLADSTDLADSALVSKSNLENEVYLFKAACAELRTEIMSRRRAEHEKMRTERTQLQHELDILSQRLNQESANLKDELKGLFDERKMTVRNEQREMESKLQQLNQRITVRLQADARSEVEGLRWVMTRRVIITLAIVVLMVVSSLKLYSDAVREAEEAKRQTAQRGSSFPQGNGEGGETRGSLGGEDVVVQGNGAAFVSLG